MTEIPMHNISAAPVVVPYMEGQGQSYSLGLESLASLDKIKMGQKQINCCCTLRQKYAYPVKDKLRRPLFQIDPHKRNKQERKSRKYRPIHFHMTDNYSKEVMTLEGPLYRKVCCESCCECSPACECHCFQCGSCECSEETRTTDTIQILDGFKQSMGFINMGITISPWPCVKRKNVIHIFDGLGQNILRIDLKPAPLLKLWPQHFSYSVNEASNNAVVGNVTRTMGCCSDGKGKTTLTFPVDLPVVNKLRIMAAAVFIAEMRFGPEHK